MVKGGRKVYQSVILTLLPKGQKRIHKISVYFHRFLCASKEVTAFPTAEGCLI